MGRQYELQAARIESVLGAHKVSARVWQATVTPRFVRYDVTTALGTRLNKVSSLAEELAFSMGVRSTRVYREAGVMHVEVPREVPRRSACWSCAGGFGWCTELRGVGRGRRGCAVVAAAGQSGCGPRVVAGTTGSGKTALLRSVVLSLAMHNPAGRLQVVLVDPKGRGLGALGGCRIRGEGLG